MHGTMRLFLAFGVLGTTMSTEFVQMGSGPWGYGYNDCKVACASYSDSTSLAGDWRLPCITSASVEFDFNAATSSYAVDGYPAPGNGPGDGYGGWWIALTSGFSSTNSPSPTPGWAWDSASGCSSSFTNWAASQPSASLAYSCGKGCTATYDFDCAKAGAYGQWYAGYCYDDCSLGAMADEYDDDECWDSGCVCERYIYPTPEPTVYPGDPTAVPIPAPSREPTTSSASGGDETTTSSASGGDSMLIIIVIAVVGVLLMGCIGLVMCFYMQSQSRMKANGDATRPAAAAQAAAPVVASQQVELVPAAAAAPLPKFDPQTGKQNY